MSAEWVLSVGHLEASIGVVVSSHSVLLAPFAWALVTSLDSNTDLTEIPAAVEATRRYPAAHFLNGGLVVPTRDLVAAQNEQRLFFGFDELWLFDSEPTEIKQGGITIVGPLDLGVSDAEPQLTEWMKRSACRLGLGDGIGMNFVTPDRDLAVTLRRILQ